MSAQNKASEGWIMRMTRTVERVGNKMPHSAYLFLYLMIIICVASAICSFFDVGVTYTTIGKNGASVETTVKVYNILSKKGIADYLTKMLTEYKGLTLLAQNIMVVMSFSVAEESGFFSALMRKSLLSAPKSLVVYALCVIGVCCNICGDAGMILACSLGAIIFKAIGRNPWIGGITGYASCAAGYTANVIPASIDANLSNITQQVCDAMGINATVHVFSNYTFMVVSTFILALVCTVICETFLVKMMGDRKSAPTPEELDKARLSPEEGKGLRASGLAFLILTGLLLWATVPADGMLRNAQGQLLPRSPLMTALVPLLFIAFVVLGSVYGIASGSIKKSKDIPVMMATGVSKNSATWVVFFFVSQFLYMFNTSKLATVISVGGERLLRSIGLTGLPLMLIFIVAVAIINVFMYSASSKYLILAPIFVPMFANLGLDPAFTQLAYRIGDSCTNSITPLNACLIACVAILNSYRDERYNTEEAGIGTIIAPTFVFCMALLITFIVLFVIFWLGKFPIGIGA